MPLLLLSVSSAWLQQEWLGNSVNVKYYESKINLNWKPIQKNIMDVGALASRCAAWLGRPRAQPGSSCTSFPGGVSA